MNNLSGIEVSNGTLEILNLGLKFNINQRINLEDVVVDVESSLSSSRIAGNVKDDIITVVATRVRPRSQILIAKEMGWGHFLLGQRGVTLRGVACTHL